MFYVDLICATILVFSAVVGAGQFFYMFFSDSAMARAMRLGGTAIPFRLNVVMATAGAAVALATAVFTAWIHMPYTTTVLVSAAILTPPTLIAVFALYRKVEREENQQATPAC